MLETSDESSSIYSQSKHKYNPRFSSMLPKALLHSICYIDRNFDYSRKSIRTPMQRRSQTFKSNAFKQRHSIVATDLRDLKYKSLKRNFGTMVFDLINNLNSDPQSRKQSLK